MPQVAYRSALCNLRFTATPYALPSALASMPGVVLYGYMGRSGLAEVSAGTAGIGAS